MSVLLLLLIWSLRHRLRFLSLRFFCPLCFALCRLMISIIKSILLFVPSSQQQQPLRHKKSTKSTTRVQRVSVVRCTLDLRARKFQRIAETAVSRAVEGHHQGGL